MPRKSTTNKGASGTGSIRKITTTRNGKQYTYWQARYTVGYDPGTGAVRAQRKLRVFFLFVYLFILGMDIPPFFK